jgi:hypothetical protein
MRHPLYLNLFSRRFYKVLGSSTDVFSLEMMPSDRRVFFGVIGSKGAIAPGSRFKTPAGEIAHDVRESSIG